MIVIHSETFGLCAYSDSNISEFIRICAYLASNVSERTTQPAIGCATKGVQTVKPYKRHKSTISFSKTSHDMHLRSKTGEELTSSWNKTPLILSFGVSHPKVTIIVTRPFLFDLCRWVLWSRSFTQCTPKSLPTSFFVITARLKRGWN